MDPIIVKAKKYKAMARAMFSMLHDVCNGKINELPIGDLLNTLPALQFERESHRQDLEDRGNIARLPSMSQLVNVSDAFATEIGFLQSEFPPAGREQLIRVRIPYELKAEFSGLGTSTFVLVFAENISERIDVRFPGNPDIGNQTVKRVTYDSNKCIIELDQVTIVADYALEPDREKFRAFAALSDFVRVSTFKNLKTSQILSVLEGYFKIEKQFERDQECDPNNRHCDSKRCIAEISYEPAQVTVREGESESQAQKRAAEEKRRAILSSSYPQPTNVFVSWSDSSGTNHTQVSSGYCPSEPSVVPEPNCFLVTANFGRRSKELVQVKRRCRYVFLWNPFLTPSWLAYRFYGPLIARQSNERPWLKALSKSFVATPIVRATEKNILVSVPNLIYLMLLGLIAIVFLLPVFLLTKASVAMKGR